MVGQSERLPIMMPTTGLADTMKRSLTAQRRPKKALHYRHKRLSRNAFNMLNQMIT